MNIQLFNNPKFGEVRVTEINGVPHFVANDVARALGYANPSKATNDHCKKSVMGWGNDSLGRRQEFKFIPEGDVYRLAAKSQLPGADEFESWIFDEVLPSIRRNGMYATEITVDKMISDPDFAIQLLTNLKLEKQKRIDAEIRLTEQAPKVLFADAVTTSRQSCLIGELAKILRQNGVDIGAQRLFKYLRSNGYLCKNGEQYNQPTQRAMEMGLFDIKKTSITKPDGTVLVTTTTKVTGKGQVYFVNKFIKANQPA